MNLINSKLKRYSAVLGGVSVVTTGAAQVQYYDVDPDTVLTLPETMVLDIDGDVVPDFIFAVSTTYGTAVTIRAGAMNGYGSNGVIGGTQVIAGSTVIWADLMAVSNSATTGAAFYTGGTSSASPPVALAGKAYIGAFSTTLGPFVGQNDAFVGFRFDISGSMHYGWIRLNCSSDGLTYIIKDWAYEQLANTSIHIGDMGFSTIGIDETSIDELVSIVGHNNTITINVGELTDGTAYLTDLQGRTIQEFNLQQGFNQFNLEEISTGIYIVKTVFNEGEKSAKIYLK